MHSWAKKSPPPHKKNGRSNMRLVRPPLAPYTAVATRLTHSPLHSRLLLHDAQFVRVGSTRIRRCTSKPCTSLVHVRAVPNVQLAWGTPSTHLMQQSQGSQVEGQKPEPGREKGERPVHFKTTSPFQNRVPQLVHLTPPPTTPHHTTCGVCVRVYTRHTRRAKARLALSATTGTLTGAPQSRVAATRGPTLHHTALKGPMRHTITDSQSHKAVVGNATTAAAATPRPTHTHARRPSSTPRFSPTLASVLRCPSGPAAATSPPPTFHHRLQNPVPSKRSHADCQSLKKPRIPHTQHTHTHTWPGQGGGSGGAKPYAIQPSSASLGWPPVPPPLSSPAWCGGAAPSSLRPSAWKALWYEAASARPTSTAFVRKASRAVSRACAPNGSRGGATEEKEGTRAAGWW